MTAVLGGNKPGQNQNQQLYPEGLVSSYSDY